MVKSVKNEARRVAALRAAGILDSPQSEEFDALCRSVAVMLGRPIARISLIDEERQWLKAAHGTGFAEIPRNLAFCDRTIAQGDVLVVEDVALDPTFTSRAGQGGPEGVRFYAGAPIMLGGRHRVGAVCVMDYQPGSLTEDQAALLRDQARIAGALIEAHATRRQLRRDRAKLRRQVSRLDHRDRDVARRDKLLLQTERMALLGGWEWDVCRRQLRLSDGVYRLMGMEGMPARSPDDVLRLWSPRSRRLLRDSIAKARKGAQPFDIEVEFRISAQEARWGRVVADVELEDEEVLRIFGTFQDITQNRTLHDELWKMANCDDLTGLAKRARFAQLFEEALGDAAAAGESVGLLVIDLDHFKHVNDTLGHRAGDVTLTVAAERLRGFAGPHDAVARLGGDEFALLVGRVSDRRDLLALAQRVVRGISEPIEFEGERVLPGASVGCAIGPEDGDTADLLMQNADLALYRAKTMGRGGACLFQRPMRDALRQRSQQITSFREAIEGRQIVPYYQPQLRLSDSAVFGFEALARWRMPDGRVATPHEFRHALDDAEACIRLGVTVLEQVASDIKTWTADGHAPGRVAVNVTAPELARGDYPERVRSIFEAEGVPLDRLTVEVIENVFLGTTADRIDRSLQSLREMGAAIALDDFGTGFASLSHLKTYPVDTIKIDRSFILGLGRNTEDQAIVTALMHLARSLGVRTIAEGVESEEQVAFLRLMGCEGAQGFLLGRPSPAREVPTFLQRNLRAVSA